MNLRWHRQLIVIGLILISCEKQNDSPILMFISPSNQYSVSLPGELMKIQIEIQSAADLKRLYISQQLDNAPSVMLLDSTINGKTFSLSLEFNSPMVIDSSKMLLLFQAFDSKNNQITQPLIIIIKNPGVLSESTGYTIYSHAGNKQDAFNLSMKESLFSALSDSSQVDLVDATSDSLSPNILSRTWKSYSGIRFVRFNDFDYANATFNYLTEVFEAGVKKSFISDIKADDIILVRTLKNRYYALRLVYVIDNDQIAEDRYIFNIKEPKSLSK